MANHASADKAARQAVTRNKRNTETKKAFRLEIKKLRGMIAKKSDGKESAKTEILTQFNNVQKILKRAANKKVIKLNNAARKISRLHKEVSAQLGK